MSIAAHLIVGRRVEPFLPALLASLAGVADRLLVDENSGDDEPENLRAINDSHFARERRLILRRSTFVDFATARNGLLALHREHNAGDWIAFVDADDVHRPVAATIARNLAGVHARFGVVDAYTRHYFQSFRWYTSIERRTAFIRWNDGLHYGGAVHEKLNGIAGAALAIPYVYDHYGWVLPMARQAEKARQYVSLGAAGGSYDEDEVRALDPVDYFATMWPLALRYHGEHPRVIAPLRAALEQQDAVDYARTDVTIRRVQTPQRRLENAARRFNFEYRWRARALDPRASALLQ